jgi:WD40 repeat protein
MASIIVGDDTGLIKIVNLTPNVSTPIITRKLGNQAEGRSIAHLAFSGPENPAHNKINNNSEKNGDAALSKESEILVGLKNGQVEAWNILTGEKIGQFDTKLDNFAPKNATAAPKVDNHVKWSKNIEESKGNSLRADLVGLDTLYSADNRSVFTVTNSGIVAIRNYNSLLIPNYSNSAGAAPNKSKIRSKAAISIPENEISPTMWQIAPDCYRARLCSYDPGVFGSGGREHLLRLHSVETQQNTWREKNVAHDELSLRQPVWITDLQFFHDSSTKLITGTAYHEARIYDINAGKRAVMNIKAAEHMITSVALSRDNNLIILGDGMGRLQQLDARNGRLLATFHQIAGSVRAVATHNSLPLLAECGLDRFLRLYDVNSRKLQGKLYLKQKLNCLLWSQALPTTIKQEEGLKKEEISENSDYSDTEAMWAELHKRTQINKRKLEGNQGDNPKMKHENKEKDSKAEKLDKLSYLQRLEQKKSQLKALAEEKKANSQTGQNERKNKKIKEELSEEEDFGEEKLDFEGLQGEEEEEEEEEAGEEDHDSLEMSEDTELSEESEQLSSEEEAPQPTKKAKPTAIKQQQNSKGGRSKQSQQRR